MEYTNIQLEPFERAIYARQFEIAGRMLLGVLGQLRVGADVVGYRNDPESRSILYTRMAAALTALISDPRFQFSQEGFDRVGSEHASMDAVFRASAFETSDHLARQFMEFTKEGKWRFLDSPNLGKFLLTFSMSSPLGMNFDKLFQIDARTTFPLYAGMLSHTFVLTERAHERREELLEKHEYFERTRLNTNAAMIAASNAFMYVSYATREDKHEVKRTINRLYQKEIRNKIPSVDQLEPRPPREKPMLMVGHEWFNSVHAMYRCFAPAIEQLKEAYHVVGVGTQKESDDVARKLHHEWIDLPDDINGNQSWRAVKIVRELRPDLIFFPSVGMSVWVMLCAVCRLAPVQMMGVGHPASSFSPMMDYMLVEEGSVRYDRLASERIIELPDGATRFLPRSDMPELTPTRATRGIDSPIVIAIPSMSVKLSVPFLQALKRIEEGAGREVVFRFLPNQQGLMHHAIDKDLRRRLKRVETGGRLSYATYMKWLGEADLHLSTFPFGGTNSNIDSMLQGIPILTLEGNEPHATIDAKMLRRIGFADLVAYDVDEYVSKALELVKHEHVRWEARGRMLEADVRGTFFGEGTKKQQGAWLRAVKFAATRPTDKQRYQVEDYA